MDNNKISNFLLTEVQLIEDNELIDFSLASKNLNPYLTYVRFVLTDDQPNANGVRVPRNEFSNLIITGLYMPIKMAEGKIDDGHDGSIPLGVITHLREDGNTIRGVAGLWNRERPSDVSYIKERYSEGKPLDLSWEIGFEDYEEDESGIKNLKGCVLRATTLVGMPAYGHGRTSITDVELSDNDKSKEDTKVDEKELKRLQDENESLKDRIAELEGNQVTEEITNKLDQFDELVQFKEEVEAEAARLQKLEDIRTKFSEAGIEKEEEYFEKNEETLLAMEESNTLDFFISNLSTDVVDEEDEEDNEEHSSEEDEVEIPDIKNTERKKELSPSQLGEALRRTNKKEDN